MTSKPTEQHLEDAMAWLLRLNEAEEADLNLRLNMQHQAWLALDPRHELAWRQISKAWSLIGKAEAPVVSNIHHLPQRRRIRVGRIGGWIGLAAAACLLLVLAPMLQQRLSADHRTATAELRQVQLADGSRLHLGAETAIAVDIDAGARRVKLLQGRAFFDVARDEARPFTVQAGDVTIAVLGTAFDVNLTDRAVSVAVKRGAVGVQADRGGVRTDARLAPGDELVIDRASGATVASKAQPEDVAGWVDGRLFVVNTPLSDVVAELRRYRRGWIVILDNDLAARTVTGLYNLQSPDTALRAMLQPVGGTARQVTPYLTILSKTEK